MFVDANGCKDTSDCFVMQSVGIVNQIFANQVKIYPNPTQGKFTIDMGEIYEKVNVEVSDLRGKRVFTQVVSNEKMIDVMLDEPAGVYLLKVEINGKRGVFKIVKE
ncbi:MAG: T9SS type A sorting domain-containing protein [Bacteroidia bacterium]